MMRRTIIKSAMLMAAAGALHSPGAAAQQQTYSFYVLHQRTVSLTAQYWNPILTYAGRKSGVPLELKLAKTAQEGNANAEAGAYAFLYTNHFFTPERDRLGYRVIARPAGPGIRSQIVVPVDSPIQSLQDLKGKEVAFVSRDGFTGYWLPFDALLRAKVDVSVVFTGNQEASSTQLRVNKVAAAGVNSSVMARYGRRESFEYRARGRPRSIRTCASWRTRCRPRGGRGQGALIGMAGPRGARNPQAGADLLKSNAGSASSPRTTANTTTTASSTARLSQ
jgi:phosphonate transport system substrate-binding protein